MNIIVTGGAGFIGSNLVRGLMCDHDVTVIDNFTTGDIANITDLRGDIQILSNANGTVELPDECDMIFHLGIPSSSPIYAERPELVGVAVSDMQEVMRYALFSGAKLVFASSSSLYNGCEMPNYEESPVFVTDYYTEARYYIERLAGLYNKLHGLDYVGLRFFSVYGPNENSKGKYANIISQFLWAMMEGKSPVIYGDGSQTRDFTFVDDVVSACILSMDKDAQGIYNVGTGKRHSFNDVVDQLNSELGTSLQAEYVPNPIDNYVNHTLASTSHASVGLGFDAKISFEEGVHKLCESVL